MGTCVIVLFSMLSHLSPSFSFPGVFAEEEEEARVGVQFSDGALLQQACGACGSNPQYHKREWGGGRGGERTVDSVPPGNVQPKD